MFNRCLSPLVLLMAVKSLQYCPEKNLPIKTICHINVQIVLTYRDNINNYCAIFLLILNKNI